MSPTPALPASHLMPMPACYARVIAGSLGLSGDDCAPLLLGSGLSPAELELAEGMVGFRQQCRIVENALRISGDPGFGLTVGAMAPLSTHGALGYAAVSSRDVRSMLDILQRYAQTRAGFFTFHLTQQDDGLALEIHDLTDLGPVKRFMHEVLMLTLQAVLETVAGPKATLASMSFSFPAPGYLARYDEAFRIPFRFGQPVSALRIPASLLSLRCITANDASLRAAEQQCGKELAALAAQASFSGRMQAAIAAHLSQDASMAAMAAHFKLSVRTLVRRLAEEGTSYRALLDTVRKQQARQYLGEGSLTVGEIAARLGYQDPSNLGRAFRNWFQMSPSAFRENARRKQQSEP